MNKIFLGILLTTIITCCQKKDAEKKSSTLQFVEIEKSIDNRLGKNQSLTSFIDTIIYIPLETNDSCTIGEIQKIIKYKEDYFIWDYNSILRFDSKGKFICKIGKRGKGPGEYLQNRGIVIQSDTIFVNAGRKIMAFDTNGVFLAKYEFPNRFFFDRIGRDFVTMNPSTGYVEFFDDKGLIVDSLNYEKYKKEKVCTDMIIYPYYNIFGRNRDVLTLSTAFNDTIFEINNKRKLLPRYVLNLGKYKLPEEFRLEYLCDFVQFDKVAVRYLRPVTLETKDFLFVQFGKWASNCDLSSLGLSNKRADLIGLGVFDKITNQFSLISEATDHFPFFYPVFSDGENCLIAHVNPIDAIEYYTANKTNSLLSKSFSDAVEKLKIDDNPLVIVTKLMKK